MYVCTTVSACVDWGGCPSVGACCCMQACARARQLQRLWPISYGCSILSVACLGRYMQLSDEAKEVLDGMLCFDPDKRLRMHEVIGTAVGTR